jgi:hypothetical protein
VEARLGEAAQALERLAEGVVAVMGRWVNLEQASERLGREAPLPAHEVRPTEHLQDGPLSWLEAIRPLENDRRLGVVAAS